MRYDTFRKLAIHGQAMPDFAGEEWRAAYAAIGEGLKVEALCFFIVPFDAQGTVGTEWNMPLRELAHNSGSGPDLGHGPIKLACRGQCSIPWHSLKLWMPAIGTPRDECKIIQQAVKANRLRLPEHLPRSGQSMARPLPPEAAPRKEALLPPEKAAEIERANEVVDMSEGQRRAKAAARFDREFGRANPRISPQQLVRQQSARMAVMRKQHEQQMAQIRKEYELRIRRLKSEISRLRKQAFDVTR